MRLAMCAMSAILLSGCSWLGMGGDSNKGQSARNSSFRYHNGGQYGQHQGRQQSHQGQQGYQQARLGPCQIATPTHPIPRGCAPENVTIANSGAYTGAQAPQYTSGGYGSHAQQGGHYGTQPKVARANAVRRPRLRGALSLGYEPFANGNLLGQQEILGSYDPSLFTETSATGTVAGGNVTTTSYDGVVERSEGPEISFGDVWQPFRVGLSGEYIFSESTTAFADAGYSASNGKRAGSADFLGSVQETISSQNFDAAGDPSGDPDVTTTTVPDQVLASKQYDFSDYRAYDLNAGLRHYFNPVGKDIFKKPVTPFVSASGGASHLSEASYDVSSQTQLNLEDTFNTPETPTDRDVTGPGRTQLYDSQWIPQGALLVGAEVQLTPRTAIALETGIKYRGGVELSSGEKTSNTFSVPVTLRTSFNF